MKALEVRQLEARDEEALLEFFAQATSQGMRETFHPHPFDGPHARMTCAEAGKDWYFGVLLDGRIVGYGMLRGWNEGFEIPSLGIGVLGTHRGLGIGRLLMEHMETFCRANGVAKMRLTVYRANEPAVALYRGRGWILEDLDESRWVGWLTL